MSLKKYSVFVLLILVFSACKDSKREEQLNKWEQSLKQREQQLSLKEADYQSLLHMRDSLLAIKDTTIRQSWPAAVTGAWKNTVICRESNCTDYVIGDQRSETWEFQSDSTGLFVRVFNDKKLVRVYAGQLRDQQIQLRFQTDSTAQRKVVMEVSLDDIKPEVVKGTQVVTGMKDCVAKFSVELVRATKP